MILTLFPMVGYIRITRYGIVVMKAKWYSLEKETLNLTDVCINLLPKEIAKIIVEYNDTKAFQDEFNNMVMSMVYLRTQIDSYDIVDYLWSRYISLFIVEVSTNLFAKNHLLKNNVSVSSLVPELSHFSKRNFYGIYQSLVSLDRKPTIKKEKNRLVNRINKMKSNLPVINRFQLSYSVA